MNRRNFLKSTAVGVLLSGSSFARAQPAPRAFPLLPLNDFTSGIEERISLSLNSGRHDFGNGTLSDTLGINHSYLGPVLKVKQGQTLPFDVANNIDDATTIHWHGLHIPGDVDGGPHQEIEQGQTWSPDVAIAQHASMNWYHSHIHGKTAQQVYQGLAGVLLIDDEASLSADLPKTYGVDDFTLVLQDKMFNNTGEMHYELTGAVFEDGFIGNTLVVNGAIAPVGQSVPAGLVRLRILNACNARFLTISMATGPLSVIASDGGFLASTVQVSEIVMSPGERYEVLVDMAQSEVNNLIVSFEDESLFGEIADIFGFGGTDLTVLTLTRTSDKGFTGSMPQSLANLSPPDPSQAMVTRSFSLEMGGDTDFNALAAAWDSLCGGGAMGINGQPMNLERINEQVCKGDQEIWRITADDMLHPFHIHGCSFRILNQQGAEPPAYAQGLKDMVHVGEGWSEVLVQFDYDAPKEAPYMYHCHILEHEDCGMMGQFTVS